MYGAIHASVATSDLARRMDGATEVQCAEFWDANIHLKESLVPEEQKKAARRLYSILAAFFNCLNLLN
jgi:hypothetical protein